MIIAEYTWTLVTEESHNRERYGQVALEWNKRIVIMGGAKMFDKRTNRRECLNDILIFDPIFLTWELILPKNYCEPRHHHAACLINDTLLIHGGIDIKDTYCSSICLLKLSNPDKWNTIETTSNSPGEIAYHSIQAVVKDVYCFGGRNKDYISDKLHVLNLNKKQWKQPKVNGRQPLARFGHTMNYLPTKGILVVFGGRDNNDCFNDVWILSLINFTWIEWKETKIVPNPRYSHCSAIVGNDIIIFGGLSAEYYCKSDIYILHFEKNLNRVEYSGLQLYSISFNISVNSALPVLYNNPLKPAVRSNMHQSVSTTSFNRRHLIKFH